MSESVHTNTSLWSKGMKAVIVAQYSQKNTAHGPEACRIRQEHTAGRAENSSRQG